MAWDGLDYAFMSPVFNSITKVGYGAAFDIDELAHAVKSCDLPVIALGGAVLSSPFRGSPASSMGFLEIKRCSGSRKFGSGIVSWIDAVDLIIFYP